MRTDREVWRAFARPEIVSACAGSGLRSSFREAARAAIVSAGGEPVLVNEDFASASKSSRNACLDAVDSCDIFLLLIGQRGGWHAPSGKLVVEEELERAQINHLRCLVFIQKGVEQDSEARRLSQAVSDYLTGYFRTEFHNEAELKRKVEEALKDPLMIAEAPIMDTAALQKELTQAPLLLQNQASIRFLISPQRNEEVLSPVRLASSSFGEQVMQIGHAPDVKLFSYHFAKSEATIEDSRFVLLQDGGSNWRSGQQEARVQIDERGMIIIDLNVTGRVELKSDRYGMGGILIDDLTAALGSCFSFAQKLYEAVDPYRRHDAFTWGAALVGSGHKRILKDEIDESSRFPNMYGTEKAVVAFPTLRPITRAGVSQPAEEIHRATLIWQQQLNKSL
jgi:hypothetical protein